MISFFADIFGRAVWKEGKDGLQQGKEFSHSQSQNSHSAYIGQGINSFLGYKYSKR